MSDSLHFHDPRRAPFSIHGLYQPAFDTSPPDPPYRRLPDDVAAATGPEVRYLCRHTAGGRVRFCTNAERITIRVTGSVGAMYHCTPVMQHGFDLYIDGDASSTFLGTFGFDPASATYEATLPLPTGEKHLTLYMPLYGEVHTLEIGLPVHATVSPHRAYRHKLPIVYYGSSITQGACASRPGIAYQSFISRRFDCDFINLGFSGSARGEDAIAAYMAQLPMAAFVSDYDHNAPTSAHLAATHYQLYETIRAENPDLPYFMVTRPNFFDTPDDRLRREIVMESYLRARRAGDNRVTFIDGAGFCTPLGIGDCRGDYTTDNTHPTDAGLARMAAVIGNAMAETMGW